MLFTDFTFLLVFLPAALLLHAVSPMWLKNPVLILLGLGFYAWGEPRYVVLLVGLVVVDYLLGRAISATEAQWLRRVWLGVGIALHVGLLSAVRVADFLRPPVGVAFYTLMGMSYLIDLYRRELPVQKNPLHCAAYLTLFPLLPAGPLVSYREIAGQLRVRKLTTQQAADGISLFVVGLSKKVLLADGLEPLWMTIRGLNTAVLPPATAWLGILTFAFRIYFDLSGYSDMAVGLGRLLGFDFPGNFDYPYQSCSVREFCSRWNVTLGQWFRRYVYEPWKGSGDPIREGLCLLAVFALTGLWYGSSWGYVGWGLYFGVLVLLERYVWNALAAKLPRLLCWLFTFGMVLIGWVFFACEPQGDGGSYLLAMFGGNRVAFGDTRTLYLLLTNLVLLVGCIFGTTRLAVKGKAFLCERMPRIGGAVCITVQVGLFLVCIARLATEPGQPVMLFS